MSEPRAGWINLVGGLVGCVLLATGILGLISGGFGLWDSFIAVLGFLIVSWAAFDYRRFRRGTAESEVDGGHVIE